MVREQIRVMQDLKLGVIDVGEGDLDCTLVVDTGICRRLSECRMEGCHCHVYLLGGSCSRRLFDGASGSKSSGATCSCLVASEDRSSRS